MQFSAEKVSRRPSDGMCQVHVCKCYDTNELSTREPACRQDGQCQHCFISFYYLHQGGYVFTCVCLFISQQTYIRIGHGPGNNPLNFGVDLV